MKNNSDREKIIFHSNTSKSIHFLKKFLHDQVSEDGRFEALPLNVTGHEVYAVLYVNYPADDLLEGTFYVEASNLYGKETYEFTFEKYIFDWEEEDPEIITEEPKEEPPTASMGAGTITGWFLIQIKFIYVCTSQSYTSQVL